VLKRLSSRQTVDLSDKR